MGYKSLDALLQSDGSVLSPQQQIGLKHYDDFLTKIPRCVLLSVMLWAFDVCLTSVGIHCRAEVKQIEQTVVAEVQRLLPNATAFACGSYRRGKLTSGDCDVLITDPDEDECCIMPGTISSFVYGLRWLAYWR